jgi:hypothetical protein
MRKLGLEQTEQKHSKKQTSCRDQRPSQNNKTTDEKSPTKAPTKVRYSRSTKKEEKQLSRGRRKLSLPLSRTNLSFKKRARAKSGESVFLIVGKYHLWYLTLNARYSVTSGRKREGDRAWCARIFCAKGGGAFLFRFLFSRRTSYQSLLVRFGFGRR